MIKSLENLQYGFESARSFQSMVTNHRILNLGVSGHSKIETFHSGGINTLDIDKIDERYMVSGANDGGLCIHDLLNRTDKKSYTAAVICEIPRSSRYSHKFSINTVQWYPFDTGMFVTSGMDAKIKIWDTNSMQPAESFNLPHKINHHHMSPVAVHHSLIAVAMESPHVLLLDPKSGSFCHELRAHKGLIPCIRWSPICEYLLATGGSDNRILFWDIRSAKSYLQSLDQHNGEAKGSRKDLIMAHNGTVNSLCFTHDGLNLVSAGTDNRLRLWDVALCTNTLVNYGLINNHNRFRRRDMDICAISNPPVIFFPSGNSVILFDLFSGDEIKELVAHFDTVNCCVFRSSTNEMFSGGNDLNILFWTPDVELEREEFSKQQIEVRDETVEIEPLDSDNWSDDSD